MCLATSVGPTYQKTVVPTQLPSDPECHQILPNVPSGAKLFLFDSFHSLGFPGSTSGKEPTRQCKRHKMQVQSLGWEDPLEKEMATHSNTHAWEVPWTEGPGGLQSVGLVARSWPQLSTHAHNSLCDVLQGAMPYRCIYCSFIIVSNLKPR